MIDFQSENNSIPGCIDHSIKNWIETIVRDHQCQVGDIVVFFCSDDYILKTNQQYLNHDYFTDIITFDYTSNGIISGDLIISVDTVASNAELLNVNFDQELLRVVIHGVLHLLGFKDKSEEEQQLMRQQEDKALSLLPTFQ